jgi:putative transcriptional regulator
MGKFADELIEGLQQAARHAAAKDVRGLRVSRVELPDVKAIRRWLRMSQHHFASAFRIPLPTLKNWEQGRRMPDRAGGGLSAGDQAASEGDHGSRRAAVMGRQVAIFRKP